MSREIIAAIFEMGGEAFLRSEPIEANPYSFADPRHGMWHRGWIAGRDIYHTPTSKTSNHQPSL